MIPESSTVVFRTDLSAQVQEYDASAAAARFIARRAGPVFPSPVCTGGYPIMRRGNFKKPVNTKRAEGGKYNRIAGEFGKGTFDCEEHGLEYAIDDRRRARYLTLFDAEKAAVQIDRFQLLLAAEVRMGAMYAAAGLTNHNVATAWTTVATAVPLDDIQDGIEAVQDACGASGAQMSLIIPRTDYRELLKTTQVINKGKYTYPGLQPAQLQAAQIAAMLGIKQVLIAQSVYDNVEKGITESNTMIWPAGVMYIAVLCEEDDPLEIPSAARTIQWTQGAPELPVVESYREENIRSDIVRSRDDVDEVMIGEVDLFAYQLTNT